jgi:hypothetical protein
MNPCKSLGKVTVIAALLAGCGFQEVPLAAAIPAVSEEE